MGAPYYGAYAAQAAMAGGSFISQLDAGSTGYAVYIIYDSARKPIHALLYNSDYYAGSGTRASSSFVLSGLPGTSLKAKRLTAASALSRSDQGSTPSFGGQTFTDVTCKITGDEAYEMVAVTSGTATFNVAASEALLVYLQ